MWLSSYLIEKLSKPNSGVELKIGLLTIIIGIIVGLAFRALRGGYNEKTLRKP